MAWLLILWPAPGISVMEEGAQLALPVTMIPVLSWKDRFENGVQLPQAVRPCGGFTDQAWEKGQNFHT